MYSEGVLDHPKVATGIFVQRAKISERIHCQFSGVEPICMYPVQKNTGNVKKLK
jgi:hypothetical protein